MSKKDYLKPYIIEHIRICAKVEDLPPGDEMARVRDLAVKIHDLIIQAIGAAEAGRDIAKYTKRLDSLIDEANNGDRKNRIN